jgi:hypothetical protein
MDTPADEARNEYCGGFTAMIDHEGPRAGRQYRGLFEVPILSLADLGQLDLHMVEPLFLGLHIPPRRLISLPLSRGPMVRNDSHRSYMRFDDG